MKRFFVEKKEAAPRHGTRGADLWLQAHLPRKVTGPPLSGIRSFRNPLLLRFVYGIPQGLPSTSQEAL
ncbi:hypothetical protein F2Q68_00006934 [Brassica cretica]|uniref:Uncharacterized protein n=1 Tax=Brassica cretica TaxID=69181 RepID=A0A8S9JEU7_BRACR|nr:hypothetical protein F2Q68_00006934 [Brassica cretica]